MTIGSGVPYNEHTGNGVTTTFSYGFTLLDDGDLVVTVDGVATSAYTVTGVGDANGGTVVFTTAPASSAAILIQRVIALVRATEYQSNGDLQAETVNDDFDRPWMAIQELSAQIGGALRLPYPYQVAELPAIDDLKGHLLGVDASGDFVPIAGADDSSAATLALDLLNTSSNVKGSGLVGHSPELEYGSSKVGAAIFARSIRQYGATTAGSAATNKTALQAAITAVQDSGMPGLIVVPPDVEYGYKVADSATWPDFSGITQPVTVIDYSLGSDYGTYPTTYNGTQERRFYHTPQTTSPGLHDGNTLWQRSTWAPNYCMSNDMDLTGSRAATDNRRARFTIFNRGLATWSMGQGSLDSSTATSEELSNFTIEKYSATGDTIGAFALIWERATGNLTIGGGTNAPPASYHFKSISNGGLPTCMLESLTTTTDLRLRTSAGSGSDVALKNVAGAFTVNVPAVGDCFSVSATTAALAMNTALAFKRRSVTYSASITIDASLGNYFTIVANNGSAFTINAPTNAVDGQFITLKISNTSGGSLGAITWNAVFKMAAWTSPATGNNRSITFYYDGTAWNEETRGAADIPN